MTDRHDRNEGAGERDDALLEGLRAATARLDPVPARVHEGARAAYTWRTIDDELLALTRDSATEREDEPVLVRTTTGPRLLVFESEQLCVEVEITHDPQQHLRLVGQLVPPVRAAIEVHHRAGTLGTESDELGRFLIDGVSMGPVRLRCRIADAEGGRSVTTQWTQL